MSSRVGKLFEKRFNKLSISRWARRARSAETLDVATLRWLRAQARSLRWELDQFLFVAEGRLALPLIGSNAMQLPLYTDWSHRPELWRGPIAQQGVSAVPTKTSIGSEATLFHDCQISELTYRQMRNSSESDLAPFGLRLDVFRFDGSFLSLSVNMPDEVCHGLSLRHLVRLDFSVDLEKPIEIFARLNVKHGPNLEQLVRELPLHSDEGFVDFDLAYTKLNEKRVEKLWVDLIFEGPEMNQIVLRDLTLSRRPRAEL
ncbi:DUF6478 family protein [Celeribacter baekdonensis]|uniref:Uncharacterized protein n=1 Tax=Celeribacter baekdonensis TaxID=875171 RepID=A0A2R4M570_9RHOB|nr:DUF6478 family protein [Celeribacter baekdonensis]AVW92331.1 hypothetical protein DA792_15550 [Celeribacter baekdonensis]|tara:strand:+ start:59630 stop:60403 length:774 start_codon:yes stop_codon:yes gene_type:complete